MLISSCAELGRQVTRKELGDRWPLSVDSGHVDCDQGALVFRYDGSSYALNMIALWKRASGNRTNLEERGWLTEESQPTEGGPDAIDGFGPTAVK